MSSGRNPRRGRVSGVSSVFLLLAAILVLGLSPAAAAPAEEDTAASIAMGRTTFRSYCQSCHGSRARGDGPVAEHLNVKPADLTTLSKRNDGEFPRKYVHKKIDGREKVKGHGTSEMPVWGDALQKTVGGMDEDAVQRRIRDLVAYVESIQE